MRELLRSGDLVRLSWLSALLADAGIDATIQDGHASILEGGFEGIPRRLFVPEADFVRARRVLAEAGEGLPDAG